MKNYLGFFRNASKKDLATFTDGFLAAMAVYDLRCPEEDDPDNQETQSWVKAEVYKTQMGYELKRSEDARMIVNMFDNLGASNLRGVILDTETISDDLRRFYRPLKGYTVDKYEVMAMLMDCAYVNCCGDEVDAEGNPVPAESHKPWPQITYHHKSNGLEVSTDYYMNLSEENKDQFKPVRYVEATDAMGRKKRICEDSYRLLDLIDDLIKIGDPINERLYRHNELANMLRERFDYDLSSQIKAFEEEAKQDRDTEQYNKHSGCVAIITGQATI